MLRDTIEKDLSRTPLGAIFEGTSALEVQPLPAAALRRISKRQKRRNRHRDNTYSLTSESSDEENGSKTVVPILIENDGAASVDPETTEKCPDPASEDCDAAERENYTDVNTPPEIEYSEIGDSALYDIPESKYTRVLSDSGIIYEIAEELYMREKTASEIEALFDPPFSKGFDAEEIVELDRRSEENARILAEKRRAELSSANIAQAKPISTSTAFVIQSLMLVPVLNIVASIFLSFRKKGNVNIKAFCRAYMIWTSIIMTLALVFFAWNYFSEPSNRPDFIGFPYFIK